MKRRKVLIVILMLFPAFICAQNSFNAYLESAKKGDANAQLIVGLIYAGFKNPSVDAKVVKDDEQAFYWISKSSEQGLANAEGVLGMMYLDGVGTSIDYEKALYWLHRSAEKNNLYAVLNIGRCYLSGKGVEQDVKQALTWIFKAAEQGLAEAQTVIGSLYWAGTGVPKNNEYACVWLKKAAEQNDLKAQQLLGIVLVSEGNHEEAFHWFKRAVDGGNIEALFMLGSHYLYGPQNTQDKELGIEYLKKAATNGVIEAQLYLGNIYYEGKDISQNYEEALKWYKLAAERGNADAQYGLGNCYYYGRGVKQNYEEAIVWYEKAVSNGNVSAIEFLSKAEEMVQKSVVNTTQTQTNIDENIPIANKTENNTYVLVIGNEKYDNEVDVPFAENDARVFKDYMTKTLGIPDNHIKCIVNAGLNSIRISLKWLKQALEASGNQGKAIVYYAGHGIPDEANKTAFLLPVDGIGSDAETGYSLDKLYTELSKMQAANVTIFLDACFSGAKRGEGMITSSRGVAIKAKQSIPKGNLVVFTAAQGDETAYPFKSQQHGMFTYFLLKRIRETKGETTFGELYHFVKAEVNRHSLLENKKIQTPSVIPSAEIVNIWQKQTLK